MRFVPPFLYHDAPNPFTLYGFKYPSIAHFLIIQAKARRGLKFRHFFDMPIEDLPPVYSINKAALEEALAVMLPEMEPQKFEYPISHEVLGIGTTRLRLKYGDKKNGSNAYGLAMWRVLKRRQSSK